jgi:glycerol-3-phosphate O-acyltransferase / dihydroxyacetone phosphate acyltransferase
LKGVVPVRRAQDNAAKGTGMIQLQTPISATKTLDSEVNMANQKQDDEINNSSKTSDNEEKKEEDNVKDAVVTSTVVEELVDNVIHVIGVNTRFIQELKPGDKIRPLGTAYALRVRSIESETCMTIDGNELPHDFPTTIFHQDKGVPFDLLKRTPLDKVFEKVLDRLAAGGAVGIFPEGGSHDRTDLLPLKVGISLIAYSALEKDGIVVPVVPVGLNYFRAHRWRGRAVVEYGKPITIDPNTLDDFKSGGMKRHHVCNEFLEKIEDSMRSVIVSAPDYETLELIHTARRLYQSKKEPLDSQAKQDLSRRFVEGYRRLLVLHDGKLPQEWLDLQNRIKDYRNKLKESGLKDYQVISLLEEHLEKMDVSKVDADQVLSNIQVPYHILHFIIVISIAAVPFMLLNLPVRLMAGIYAEKRRKKALANSKVKIRGYDVRISTFSSLFDVYKYLYFNHLY